MQRSRISGFIACAIALVLAGLFINYAFVEISAFEISDIGLFDAYTYYALAIPISLVALAVCGTDSGRLDDTNDKGAPPMPEIVEKKDYAKSRRCSCVSSPWRLRRSSFTGCISELLGPGRSAAAVTLVVLGMVFWSVSR